jgi:hypothetical protein
MTSIFSGRYLKRNLKKIEILLSDIFCYHSPQTIELINTMSVVKVTRFSPEPVLSRATYFAIEIENQIEMIVITFKLVQNGNFGFVENITNFLCQFHINIKQHEGYAEWRQNMLSRYDKLNRYNFASLELTSIQVHHALGFYRHLLDNRLI